MFSFQKAAKLFACSVNRWGHEGNFTEIGIPRWRLEREAKKYVQSPSPRGRTHHTLDIPQFVPVLGGRVGVSIDDCTCHAPADVCMYGWTRANHCPRILRRVHTWCPGTVPGHGAWRAPMWTQRFVSARTNNWAHCSGTGTRWRPCTRALNRARAQVCTRF